MTCYTLACNILGSNLSPQVASLYIISRPVDISWCTIRTYGCVDVAILLLNVPGMHHFEMFSRLDRAVFRVSARWAG